MESSKRRYKRSQKGKGYASDASDFLGAETLVGQVVEEFRQVDIWDNAGNHP